MSYPVSISVQPKLGNRNRLTTAFRVFLAIPHFIMLVFVMLAWALATVVAWFAILFTGAYPRALVAFSIGALRWRLRVEAYLLLMVDAYPPFSLE